MAGNDKSDNKLQTKSLDLCTLDDLAGLSKHVTGSWSRKQKLQCRA